MSGVIFIGSQCVLSGVVLRGLIDRAVDVRAVIVPSLKGSVRPGMPTPSSASFPDEGLRDIRPPRPLRIELSLMGQDNNTDLLGTAWSAGIYTAETPKLSADIIRKLVSAHDADLICCVCWPHKLPRSVLTIPRLGCLNVHPSLLPKHRGPAPVFWALRAGEDVIGVTVHRMDEGLDTGPIVEQEAIRLPEGISGREIDVLCGRVGSRLLAQAVGKLMDGGARFREQAEAGSSYEPWPSESDFEIDADMPVRVAYNFIRGTADWGMDYPVRVSSISLRFEDATGYVEGEALGRPFVLRGDRALIQLAGGVLETTIKGGSARLADV